MLSPAAEKRPMQRRFRRVIAIGLVPAGMGLAGCAPSLDDAPPGPPSWREGWVDGCAFVRALGGGGTAWSVDVTRRAGDADYGRGLEAGSRECDGTPAIGPKADGKSPAVVEGRERT
jgi:hypothetical protein